MFSDSPKPVNACVIDNYTDSVLNIYYDFWSSHVDYSWRTISKLDSSTGIPFFQGTSLLFQYLHEDNAWLFFHFKWAKFVGGESRTRKTKTIWNASSFIWGLCTGFPLLPESSWPNFLTLFCLLWFCLGWRNGEDGWQRAGLEGSSKVKQGGGPLLFGEAAFLSPQDVEPAPGRSCSRAVLLLTDVRRVPFPWGFALVCVLSKSLRYALDKLPAMSWTELQRTGFPTPRGGTGMTELPSARERGKETWHVLGVGFPEMCRLSQRRSLPE